MTTDPVIAYPVVTPENFPHGLMCPECGQVIEVGQPFKSVGVGVYDSGVTFGRLVCVYC